ncbi:hypothetical protein HYW35_04180 [Candidatus Saccharibacteria bacterium]|nr:hypothetical protein [Candidatus Saccharibacteria bacterium]
MWITFALSFIRPSQEQIEISLRLLAAPRQLPSVDPHHFIGSSDKVSALVG